MEAGYDTLLKLFETVLGTAANNPWAVVTAVVVLFGAFGYIKYQMKKTADRQIDRDRQRDRADNIDELEADSDASNDSVRRRVRQRRK